MNLKKAMKEVSQCLEKKQDPDSIEFFKQWDEFGALKGWMVRCSWIDSWGDRTHIDFDKTNYYTRILGNLDTIPDYKPGVHQM